MMTSEKDPHIQSLRGLAVLLIVAGHAGFFYQVFAHDYGHGEATFDTWLDTFFIWSMDVRMPLFTIISGFIYAHRPVRRGSFGKFSRGKARRIGVPLLFLLVLEFFFVRWRQGRVEDPYPPVVGALDYFLLVPACHLWFLYAILWIFLLVAVLDWLAVMDRMLGWLAVLVLACVGNLQGIPYWGMATVFGKEIPNYFGYASFLYLCPFFFLGLGLNRFRKQVLRKEVVLAVAVILIGRIIWAGELRSRISHTQIALLTSLTSTYLFLAVRWKFGPLAWLGEYSYPIYLFHGYAIFLVFEAVYRVVGLPPYTPFALGATVVAVLLPIALFHGLSRVPIARMLFLGLKPFRSGKT